MDKKVSQMVGSVMKNGEKQAPVKSIKLKVKFQKAKSKALKDKMK